ncbi:hypothetical protein F383_37677 [Gossypium arboreum]|uniref:Uncharacterized protein n=1 Tax=Gossypium arboreum TaxID=29729 RepID=A0A0B0MG41_GOSAR|nr:hypothetical protein F383_37677 [Gossypium arboreum]
MFGTCIGYEMCQCQTMFGTWHQHGYVRARMSQCKTMSGTWHQHYTLCLRLGEYPIVFQMVQCDV